MVIRNNQGKGVSIITDIMTYGSGPFTYNYDAEEYTSVHLMDKEVIVYNKTEILVYLNREHVVSVHFYD